MKWRGMSDTIPTDNSIENPASPSYSILVFKASELPKSYFPLIYARWLRSFKHGNGTAKKISSKEYHEHWHHYITVLMGKPDSLVRMAVLSDDHDVVLGFSVSREDVLDYVHVHTDFRRIGIGKHLVPEKITTFTHLTAVGVIIWQKRKQYKEWKFNPFA